ncbi:MAG: hypothetical protein ACHQWU_07040 [Gemmatimonadales bacterium]
MADDDGLGPVLAALLRSNRVTHVIETGTYLGTGSTRMLASAFPTGEPPESFVTIEANWSSWRAALANLAGFPFVKALWGRTVTRAAALAFVRSDEALKHHERWPDVFIDDTRHPIKSYTRELRGRLGGRPRGTRAIAQFIGDRMRRYSGENLLSEQLQAAREKGPLILLDSAGGIGWLEFQTVLRDMSAVPFTIVLDDTHHVKHFRSLAHIRGDSSFTVVAESPNHGWIVARRGSG